MIEEPYLPAHITPDELIRRKQVDPKLLVLDLRSRFAFDRGHIVGALSLPVVDVQARWAVARGASLVVVYGEFADDPDAQWVARFLGKHGLLPVMVLEGGYSTWIEAGLPTRDEMRIRRPPDRGGRLLSFPSVIRPEDGDPTAETERKPIGISPEAPTGRVFRDGTDAVTSVPDEHEDIARFLAHGDGAETGAP